MLRAGLEEATAAHGAIGQVVAFELWLDMLPHFFAGGYTHHALPDPWEDAMPDLHSTQLWMAWVATPGGRLRATLVCQPSLNWLTTTSSAYIHRLLEVLAPPTRQLQVGDCGWCLHSTAGWMHTL